MIQCDNRDRIFYTEHGDVGEGICGVLVSAECGGVEGGLCGDELGGFKLMCTIGVSVCMCE